MEIKKWLISASLPEELHKELSERSKTFGVRKSFIVGAALREYFERNPRGTPKAVIINE